MRAADFVVDLGAGTGAITAPLAERARHVLAIELDRVLAAALAERYRGSGRVEVQHADILEAPLPSADFTVVANIPFGETASIVSRLLESRARDVWLVVQREAAERYTGQPWAHESMQSLLLKPWWHAEIRGYPARTDFDPPPRVETAVLHLQRRVEGLVAGDAYARFIARTFGRGQTIAECMRTVLTRPQLQRLASDLGFALQQRPSELTFGQWLGLYRYANGEVL